jgi:hypothetical protein
LRMVSVGKFVGGHAEQLLTVVLPFGHHGRASLN